MFGNKKEKSPLLRLSKEELANIVQGLQNQNAALHAELTVQHERANESVRVIRDHYNFLFNTLHSYIGVLAHYREQPGAQGNAVPAMWLAARIAEHFEVIFNTRMLEHYDIGPDRLILKNIYAVANRPIPEGNVKNYLLLGFPEDELKDRSDETQEEKTE